MRSITLGGLGGQTGHHSQMRSKAESRKQINKKYKIKTWN